MQGETTGQRVPEKVRQTIRRHDMLAPGESVLVGISGGADSVCLLHVLWALQGELGIRVLAAHVNHGIRGEEADRDQEFVRSLCARWDVPLFEENIQVRELAKEEGISLETAGRLARYRFFSRIAGEQGITKTATAHNRNDQAETVLMRILRGTGIDGLAGIQYCRRDGVIRPLLDVEREEIEAYCAAHGLRYCTDSTNGENSYTRNRIRNQLIPELQAQFNPGIVQTLSVLAENMAEDGGFIDGYTRRLYRRINSPAPAKKPVVLDIASLAMVEPCVRIRLVRLAARDAMGDAYALERRHVDAVLDLLEKETGAQAELPGGLRAAVRYGWLAFETLEETAAQRERPAFSDSIHYAVELGRTYDMEDWSVTLELGDPDAVLRPNQMILDYDKVRDLSLEVRTRRRGDRIAVYRDGRTRKLKDFMIDLKIPRLERGTVPLLCADGGEVVAVIGRRIAEPYKIGDDSKRGLVITYDTVDEGR